jgi:hypothetical protein
MATQLDAKTEKLLGGQLTVGLLNSWLKDSLEPSDRAKYLAESKQGITMSELSEPLALDSVVGYNP